MKRLLLILCSAFFAATAFATPSIQSFSIYSNFIQNGAIKVYSNGPSGFIANFSCGRQYIGSGLESVNLQIRLVVKNSSNQDVDISYNSSGVSTVKTLTSADFSSTTPEYSGTKDIEGTIPVAYNSSRVYLQMRYMDNGAWSDWITANTNYATVNVSTPVTPPTAPTAFPPVVGSVPLYEFYSQSLKNHYYTTTYDNYSGYAYSRILGYVFTTQQFGTVPLYRYKSAGHHQYSLVLASSIGNYAYEGIACYVYSGQESQTALISRYFSTTDGDFRYFDESPASIDGYTFESSSFYVLENNQLQTNYTSNAYEYWSSSLNDHLYTKNSTDPRPEYSQTAIPFKILLEQAPGAVPIFSFWNNTDKDHYYSKANVSTIGGGLWAREGIAFYAYASDGPGRVPVYEYWSNSSTDHYYTTLNVPSISGQWANTGIAFYALP